jgi:hypothetical protein
MTTIRKALLALAAAALSGCADVPMNPDTRSFDWLAGCWHVDRADGGYDEFWLPPTADGTIGVSREVRRGRTVAYEFLRIELRPGPVVAYIAAPSGQAPAEFLLAEHEPGKLVFENPKHDFPTRIEYRLIDLNTLLARIAGTRNGATQTVDYPLRRVACEG